MKKEYKLNYVAMRRIYTFVLLFLVVSYATAQYTAIPDSNFEQELIDQGIDSEGGVPNGQVLTADIAAVDVLIVNGTFKPDTEKISDLTGIEDFTALRVLRCAGNFLTDLDVSNNFNLEELQCQLNSISYLDVSNNTSLDLLYCNNNLLTRLDVSNNPMLSILRCQSNQITTLDLTGVGNALTELRCNSNNLQLNLDLSQNSSLTTFSGTTNPDLLCIQVANASDADAGIGIYTTWSKDAVASYSEDCEALFPTTSIPDGRFEQALINLGHDVALDNRVLTANISGLISLDVSGESIIDLTGIEDFVTLNILRASNNNIINLDMSQNPGIELLDCSNNDISSLNIDGLVNLTELDCSNNNLFSLDVSQATALESLSCGNNVNLGTLDVSGNVLLEILRCSNSGLTSLDITSNTILLELYANFNLLTEVDMTLNPVLQMVQISGNQLTFVDVTTTSTLAQFYASDNQLQGGIDLSGQPVLIDVNVSGNDSLYCIQVDNAADADAGLGIYAVWNKDAFAVYSETCSDILTYVPDDAFEDYLETNFFGGEMDNYVLTADIIAAEINELELSSLGIEDMTGIEAFIDLVNLSCSDNSISTLDLSQNILLEVLDFGNNQLTAIDLTSNTALTSLLCNGNMLTALDISQNPNLGILDCSNNDLDFLDVSGNGSLTNINCSSNQLDNLVLAGATNTNLLTLNASDNRLPEARVHHYVNLTTLLLNDNLLASAPGNNGGIYLTPLASLTTLDVTNNPSLVCIMVADAVEADAGLGIYAGWLKDAGASYSIDCAGVLSSDEFEVLDKAIKVYPNPVRENLFVTFPNDVTIEKATIYNMQGRRVMQISTIEQGQGINVTSLQNGLYFLAIETEDYTITKKIIVSR